MGGYQLHRCRGRDLRSGPASRCIIDGAPDSFGGQWVVASRPLMRLRGLAGRTPDKTALVLPRCRDVHTFTMRHNLDIAFLDKAGTVVEVHRLVLPKTRLRNPQAVTVIERFSRPGPWLKRGDQCLFGATTKKATRLERRRDHENLPRVRQRALR